MKARERLNRLYAVLSRFGMEHEEKDLLLRIGNGWGMDARTLPVKDRKTQEEIGGMYFRDGGNGTMDDTRLDAFLDYMEAWLDKEE